MLQVAIRGVPSAKKKKKKKDKTKFGYEQREKEVRLCFFVLQVCVNAACVPAEKFHSRCIILSVGSFSLLLSHLVWDECVCASLSECVCVYVLLLSSLAQNPPLSSAQDARSGPTLCPVSVKTHRNWFWVFCQGERQHVSQRRSLLTKSTLDHQRRPAPATPVLVGPRTAKQQEGNKRRSQSGEYSEPNLSGGPLSRQHCLCCPLLLEGTVRWGTADGRVGSQLVTVRDDRTKPKEGVLMELLQGLAC